ncbi:MAG: hypothetical protein Q8K28_19060, partial [Hoeflea sp.]|uniref:hypothetical protein n=1 Tax=Hoeflea sp. TaxID=1940281 RepID=UPI002730E250
MSPRLDIDPAGSTLSPDLSFKNVDNASSCLGSGRSEGDGNRHLADADLMTRDQEKAWIAWRDEASHVKRRKADRRRKAEARKLDEIQSRPERLAAQNELTAANGGRLPPRWRYEDATKKVQGQTVEYKKRVANRPAFLSSYPYDPEIDGRGFANFQALAIERRDRINHGFRLRENTILSGCLVGKGLEFEGFKSETLGTKSALRWPALVHKSRQMRVCWHRTDHSDLELDVAAARSAGVPAWMLQEFGIDDVEEEIDEDSAEDTNVRALENAHFKVLGLDAPTVEGNKTLLGFLRLDTDLVWKSTDHLLRALKKKVRRKKIKSLPNFIVGIRTEDGKLIRPHLIWLLPIDNGILNIDNKFLRKFKAVYYGLCHALADLGADAQAPATSQMVKNPLSPLYYTECPSDAWPSLNDHASCLDMSLNRIKLVRENIATVTGETFRHSNEFFNGCLDAARTLMVRWHQDQDLLYTQAFANEDYDLLKNRLKQALSTLVVANGMKPRSIEYARHKVVSWVVDTWDPTKIGGTALASPGRLSHIVSEIQGVRERQAVAGRYTAAKRAAESLTKLVTAWNQLIENANGEPSKSALATASGLSRQTVHNRFEDLQAALTDEGVKDAVCYIGGHYPHTHKKTIIDQPTSTEVVGKREIISTSAYCGLKASGVDHSDLESLAEQEAWIGFQEDRPVRSAIWDTFSASVGP